MFGDCSIGCVSQIGATKQTGAPILVSCLFRWKRRQRINAVNEKTIDQIEEEVVIYEISDEAVEVADTRAEIAGVWTFVCTGIQCSHLFALKQ